MPDEQTQPDSSPAPDALAAPSSAPQEVPPVQASEQAPPPSSQPEPAKPWNMPPEERWEELRRERDEARRQYHELASRPAPVVQPPAQSQADPWEGLVNHPDPATAQFYQQQRRLVEHAVQQGRDQAFRELQPMLALIQEGQAALTLKDFRKENPDIKPNSEEERQVRVLMQPTQRYPYGLDLYTAKSVVRERLLESENRALKAKSSSVQVKVAANASEASSGIPATAGLPGQRGDWREKVRESARKGGSLADMLNAAGAVRAT